MVFAYQTQYRTDPDTGEVRCLTKEAFLRWVKDAGWESIEHFRLETGVTWRELKGKWFTTIHNRVFIRE